MELERYQFVLLRSRGHVDADDETVARIQREHLAFYARLRDSGEVVTNGPFREQADQALRGMVVLALPSLCEAEALVAEDPAVRAGWLFAEAMTWLCRPGTMTRPGMPVTVDD